MSGQRKCQGCDGTGGTAGNCIGCGGKGYVEDSLTPNKGYGYQADYDSGSRGYRYPRGSSSKTSAANIVVAIVMFLFAFMNLICCALVGMALSIITDRRPDSELQGFFALFVGLYLFLTVSYIIFGILAFKRPRLSAILGSIFYLPFLIGSIYSLVAGNPKEAQIIVSLGTNVICVVALGVANFFAFRSR